MTADRSRNSGTCRRCGGTRQIYPRRPDGFLGSRREDGGSISCPDCRPTVARIRRPQRDVPAQPDGNDLVGKLERLHALLVSGAISEDEYQEAKRLIIGTGG